MILPSSSLLEQALFYSLVVYRLALTAWRPLPPPLRPLPHGDHTLDHYLANALRRLAEHGFIRIEPAAAYTPDLPTLLAFRLASPRPATTAAREALQAYGRLLGRVLSPEKPMMLDQIMAACQALVAEEGEGKKPLSPMVVASWLLELAEVGVVEVLQAEVSP